MTIEILTDTLRKMSTNPQSQRSASAILDLLDRNPQDRRRVDLKTLSFLEHVAGDRFPDTYEMGGEPEQFAAEDWTQLPDGPRGGKRWQRKGGGKPVYSATNPGLRGGGKAKGSETPASGPKKTSAPKSPAPAKTPGEFELQLGGAKPQGTPQSSATQQPKADSPKPAAATPSGSSPKSGGESFGGMGGVGGAMGAIDTVIKGIFDYAKSATNNKKLVNDIAQVPDLPAKGQQIADTIEKVAGPMRQDSNFEESVSHAINSFDGGLDELVKDYGYVAATAIGTAAMLGGGAAALASGAIAGFGSGGALVMFDPQAFEGIISGMFKAGAAVAAAPLVALASSVKSLKNKITGGPKQYAADSDEGDAQPDAGDGGHNLSPEEIAHLGLQFYADMLAKINGEEDADPGPDAGSKEGDQAEQYARAFNSYMRDGLAISREDYAEAAQAIRGTGRQLIYEAHAWHSVTGTGVVVNGTLVAQ